MKALGTALIVSALIVWYQLERLDTNNLPPYFPLEDGLTIMGIVVITILVGVGVYVLGWLGKLIDSL